MQNDNNHSKGELYRKSEDSLKLWLRDGTGNPYLSITQQKKDNPRLPLTEKDIARIEREIKTLEVHTAHIKLSQS